jgi:hypothetical protein
MQNANTCDTALRLFTRLDMHKNPPHLRNSEPVFINANIRAEEQSVNYVRFRTSQTLSLRVRFTITVQTCVQTDYYLSYDFG